MTGIHAADRAGAAQPARGEERSARGAFAAGGLIVAGAALALSWLIFERTIRAGGSFEWDEAYHSLYGLLIADDLTRAQLVSFAFDTYRQVYWPPLHSWYLALLFIPFGPSITLARVSGLLALIGTAVAIYLAARLVATADQPSASSPRAAAIGGIAAAASLLASGAVQELAAQVMLEVPALFWLAVSFWLYGRCRSTRGRASERAYLALGFAVFATYLTRTNYGVLLALALTVAFLIDGRWLGRRRAVGDGDAAEVAASAARRRGHLLAALALGVPLALWLAYPPKIGITLSTLSHVPEGPERFSLDGLLFYPRATLWLAGAWPLLLGWLVAAGLTLRPRLLRSNGPLRLVVIFLGVHMLLAELAVTKHVRHSFPLVLGFSLLVGFWTSRLAARLSELGSVRAPRLAAVAGSFAAIGALATLPWQVRDVGASAPASAAPPPSALLEYLADDIRRHGPCLLLGSVDLPESPAAIDWHLAVGGLLALDGAGSLVAQNDIRFVHSGDFSRAPALVPRSIRAQVDRWPGVSGTYTAYVGLPFGAPELAFSPSNYRERVAAMLARHPVDRILVVTGDDEELTPRFVTARLAELTPDFVIARLAELGFERTAPEPRVIPGAGVSTIELKRP